MPAGKLRRVLTARGNPIALPVDPVARKVPHGGTAA